MRAAINDTFPEPNRRLLQRYLIDNNFFFSFLSFWYNPLIAFFVILFSEFEGLTF